MAKCTKDWDECSGFFGCIVPALKTAGKCTASYFEDTTHAGLQFHRDACLKAVTCTLDKYQSGKLDLSKTYQWLTYYLSGWTPNMATLPEYWIAGNNPSKALIDLRNSAQHQAGQTIPEEKYGSSGVLVSNKFGAAGYGVQTALPVFGNFFSKSYRLLTINQFSKGPCPQFSSDDVNKSIKEVIKAYVKSVATAAGGDVKLAYDGLQALLSGKPSEIVMNSLFSFISDPAPDGLGIEVPDAVKAFLTCLYNKAGASVLLQTVKLALVDFKEKEAGQLIAPYAIDCGAKSLKDQLDPSSPLRPLISAIAVAVEAYVAPAPSVPAPQTGGKPPVTGASSASCPQGYYKSLTGECKPEIKPSEAKSGSVRPKSSAGNVRVAPAGACKGPFDPDVAARCAEYNTPFWDAQRKTAAAGLGATGPDASGEQQLAYDKALAAHSQQKQTQTLLLVGAAVVAFVLLSK